MPPADKMSQYCRYKCEFMCSMCEQAERVTIVAPPASRSHPRLPWNGWEGDTDEYEYPTVMKYDTAGAPTKPYEPVFVELTVGEVTEIPEITIEPLALQEGVIKHG